MHKEEQRTDYLGNEKYQYVELRETPFVPTVGKVVKSKNMVQVFTTLKGIVKSGRKHGTWNIVPDVRKMEQKLLIKLFKRRS